MSSRTRSTRSFLARAARPRRSVLLVAALVACVGCSEDGNGGSGALDALERMTLVPPGECRLLARFGPPTICENREGLLVARYEVTRRELSAWLAAGARSSSPELASRVADWTDETLDWPASFMTRGEAERYAKDHGLRLPTAREWMRVASGTGAQPWPWGPSEILSAANTLTLRLDRACPVGTFEQGRTPFGTYDMLGNVWEWVADEPSSSSDVATAPVGELVLAMGGSYTSRQRRLYESGADGTLVMNAQELDPETRSSDVGMRCVIEAVPYLRAHAAEIERARDARERLRRLGARWGREAAPYLQRIAREGDAPQCVRWLGEGLAP